MRHERSRHESDEDNSAARVSVRWIMCTAILSSVHRETTLPPKVNRLTVLPIASNQEKRTGVSSLRIWNLQSAAVFSDSIKNSYRYRNHIPPNIDTAIPRWTKIHFDIWRLNNPARLRRTRFSAGKWIKIRAEQSERRKEKERKKRERILPLYGYKVLGSGLAPSDPRVVRIGKPWSKSADMSMRVGSRLRLVLGKVECAGWEGLFVKGMEEDGILERRY